MSGDETAWAVILLGYDEEAAMVASTVPEGVLVVIRETDGGNHAVIAKAESASAASALRTWAAGLESNDLYQGGGIISVTSGDDPGGGSTGHWQ